MNYPNISTIRYMGNKNKLLDYIIPEIEKITNPGDMICDLMAGTNSVGYALKKRNIIISNDIQYYSFVIAKCLLSNYKIPTISEVHADIDYNYNLNLTEKKFNFFEHNYVDTYFSLQQCIDIDSLRYAIENINSEKKYLYLVLLMNAMCKAQSSPGHFAQYMDKNHNRLKKIRQLSIYDLFYAKIDEFKRFETSCYDNECFNLDYNVLLEQDELMKKVSCFYLDSPYTTDQYSRFYHILETVCRYDNPSLSSKAKYRDNRAKSEFCYKRTVEFEFDKIIKFTARLGAKLVISYSNHGVISVDKLLEICYRYYDNVELKEINYKHSSQGNGSIDIKEIVIILK